eukprot:8467132-Lingulodinium_polyedra.AAC.1
MPAARGLWQTSARSGRRHPPACPAPACAPPGAAAQGCGRPEGPPTWRTSGGGLLGGHNLGQLHLA